MEKQYIPIFVSSTYEDLKDHRVAVKETLHKLETIVYGMEYFGSKPGSPKEECLASVRKSRIYIGIFAMRYGSIDDSSGLSMTHLEYLEAQKNKLPSLIYILDENKQNLPSQYIDVGDKGEKLAQLKNELKKKFVVSFFTTPDDLAKRVSEDLQPLLNKTNATGKNKNVPWSIVRVIALLFVLFGFIFFIYANKNIHTLAEKYKTVTIGDQVWMTDNLDVSTFQDGYPIHEAEDIEDWKRHDSLKKPCWCYYPDNKNNVKNYGKLYNWYAVSYNDHGGIAPVGWHVPRCSEFNILLATVGGQHHAGKKLKTKSGWFKDGNGTDDFGWTGVPTNFRGYEGGFHYSGGNWGSADYWSADEDNGSTGNREVAYRLNLSYATDAAELTSSSGMKGVGMAIRCIKD